MTDREKIKKMQEVVHVLSDCEPMDGFVILANVIGKAIALTKMNDKEAAGFSKAFAKDIMAVYQVSKKEEDYEKN
jgi:hypothetical protein